MKVVVVGGAGVFGSRLVEGLRRTTGATIVVAGRSRRDDGVTIDRMRASVDDIRALGADLIIDAAGPFQGADLRFARVVLEAGADYIDLADARDFVAAFPVLNTIARDAGRVAITGASSTPALTHAALDALVVGWRRVDVVRAGIAPAHRTPRGRSLIEAVLQSAGAPLQVFDDGVWRERRGWSHHSVVRINGLGRRRFALVDTPDLDLVPKRFAVVESAVFLAALEATLLHRGVEVVGALRALGLWRHPERAAGLMQASAALTDALGGDCGAMFVEALGRDGEDRPVHARWTLLAPAGRGPYAPTLPALAMARHLLEGRRPALGARACIGVLQLDDLAPDFAHHAFEARVDRARLETPFAAALGEDFDRAPAAVQNAHRSGPVARFSGEASVTGGAGVLARLARLFIGFPEPVTSTPVKVVMTMNADGRETWRRTFGKHYFQSHLSVVGSGRVRERFGLAGFDMALGADVTGISMRVVGWRLAGIPMPSWLAPRSNATETVDAQGRFRFDVPIALPLIGLVTHYSGWLVLERVEAEREPAMSAAP